MKIKKRTKWLYIAFFIIILFVLIFIFYGCPRAETYGSFIVQSIQGKSPTENKYYIEEKNNADYFGPARIKYITIAYECTEEEKEAVKPIMDKLEKVISYTGKKVDADKDIGKLDCLYHFRYSSNDQQYASVKYDIEFITAKLSGINGYMWIRYSVEYLDESGKVVRGSIETPCYLKLKKISNEWVVTDVTETA